MVGDITPVPGTRDVTLDLQNRTALNADDKILMVNSETQQMQFIKVSQLSGQVTLPEQPVNNPVFSNSEIFDI